MRLTRTLAAGLAALACTVVGCETGDTPISGSAALSGAAVSSTLTDEEAKALVYGFCSSGPSVRHGECVSCVAKALNSLRSTGQIDGAQRGGLQSWFAETGCAVLPTSLAVRVSAGAGGTVSLIDGPTLQVPAGALTADTVITIRQSDGTLPNGALTPVYELLPSGTTFNPPATISFPLPSGIAAASIWMRSAGMTDYQSLPTTLATSAATAQASHFTDFTLGPADLDGTTWVGTISYTSTLADGSAGPPGSFLATRHVTGQSVGDMHYSMISSFNTTGLCDGILNAATSSLTWACSYATVGGVCTGTATHTDPVDLASTPPTMTVAYFPMTWVGGPACSIAGQTWTFAGTFTQQSQGP